MIRRRRHALVWALLLVCGVVLGLGACLSGVWAVAVGDQSLAVVTACLGVASVSAIGLAGVVESLD